MNDYLITVVNNETIISNIPVFEQRLIDVSKDYAEGYLQAVRELNPKHTAYINELL